MIFVWPTATYRQPPATDLERSERVRLPIFNFLLSSSGVDRILAVERLLRERARKRDDIYRGGTTLCLLRELLLDEIKRIVEQEMIYVIFI